MGERQIELKRRRDRVRYERLKREGEVVQFPFRLKRELRERMTQAAEMESRNLTAYLCWLVERDCKRRGI